MMQANSFVNFVKCKGSIPLRVDRFSICLLQSSTQIRHRKFSALFGSQNVQTLAFQTEGNTAQEPFPPMEFPTDEYSVAAQDFVLEEETFDHFKMGAYYPVKIGDIFDSRYQVVGKLGFGVSSTVWLAINLQLRTIASLKVFLRGIDPNEINIYNSTCKSISAGDASLSGSQWIRTPLDSFTIPRQGGDHQCLVQRPMWDTLRGLLHRIPTGRFCETLLKMALGQVLLSLDCVHSVCKLVHTDIKPDNIFIEFHDQETLDSFIIAEFESPSPRKVVDGAPVYKSRSFDVTRNIGKTVLGDFGLAVCGNRKNTHLAQPDCLRCPEVMLGAEWSYAADIWNVGAMIWDLFEGKYLFSGNHPDGSGYTTRAHLAEVIGLLGPPPLDLLNRGSRSKKFFDEEGNWIADAPIPKDRSLESLEENLTGEEQQEFLRFVRSMLQWRPEDRKTARELLADLWLTDIFETG